MKITGKAIGIVIAVIVAVVVLMFVTGGIRYVTAPFRGEVAERERVQADPDFRIASYNAFYEDCEAIAAVERQIENARADRSLPADQRSTNILALQNTRENLIAEYNANASQTDTRANFLASDLPYRIDPESETTTCAA